MPRKHLSLENIDILDETEFEEFCFERLEKLGFVNIDWRKGTACSCGRCRATRCRRRRRRRLR
jgi:hypothetical protein